MAFCRLFPLHFGFLAQPVESVASSQNRLDSKLLAPATRCGQNIDLGSLLNVSWQFRTENHEAETVEGRVAECWTDILTILAPNSQKIDTRVSGVPRIFECQIASYDRPASGEVRGPFAEIGADSRA